MDGKDKGTDKLPAAVELGERGGKKGGPARAKALSADEREQIARKGAAARWSETNTTGSDDREQARKNKESAEEKFHRLNP